MLQIFVQLRWNSGVKNHELWTFKVNFLCQKTFESFQKKINEDYQFRKNCKIHFWIILISTKVLLLK